MPKRFGNLFDKCFTLDSLYDAYETARKGKNNKRQVFEFKQNLGANLQELLDELTDRCYEPRGYTKFTVREPKERTIYAPHFRDTVVQHAIYKVIYPIFDATFIHDSYGCRKGKGTHRAANQAQKFLRKSKPDSFILQLDIRKFFYRIDRRILKSLIEHKIKDKRIINLIVSFADYEELTGIPIGNLLSQLCALIYLNGLDHYIKRELKIKFYVRYVDDFILFDLTKEQAHDYKRLIESYIKTKLNLELSKHSIHKSKRGLNFVGFRTWRKTRVVRKHSLHKFSKALKRENLKSLTSLLGHARYSATFKHYCNRIRTEKPNLINRLSFLRSPKCHFSSISAIKTNTPPITSRITKTMKPLN